MDFATAADELYSVPPSHFTAERKRLAGELSREEARRLAALHKPTVPAWAVNLLVRDDAVAPLLDLGERMRRAWSSGGDVGALERERGDLVDGLVRRARELADAAGRPLSDAFARDVEDTLQAAIADPSAAEEVRTGRLRHPLSHSGFGPLGAVPPAPAARPERAAGQAPGKARKAPGKAGRTAEREAHTREARRREIQRREEETRAADARADEADRSLADWETERDAARQRLSTAEEAAARLRERLRAAEAERADLERQVRVAERERDRAARAAERARRDAGAARHRAEDARRAAPDDE